jgi:hypothetical protein
MRVVTVDAVTTDFDRPMPAGTHLIVAIDADVGKGVFELVGIRSRMRIMAGVAAILQGGVDIGTRWFVVVAFLTGGCWIGGRSMGVVTFLALIFLESGMFIGLVGYIGMTGLALSNRARF